MFAERELAAVTAIQKCLLSFLRADSLGVDRELAFR